MCILGTGGRGCARGRGGSALLWVCGCGRMGLDWRVWEFEIWIEGRGRIDDDGMAFDGTDVSICLF